MKVRLMGSGPVGVSEQRAKPRTFLFQLVNAECVQVTIRTKESPTGADPNFRPDSGGPSVKRSRPPIGFVFHRPVSSGHRVDENNIPASALKLRWTFVKYS